MHRRGRKKLKTLQEVMDITDGLGIHNSILYDFSSCIIHGQKGCPVGGITHRVRSSDLICQPILIAKILNKHTATKKELINAIDITRQGPHGLGNPFKIEEGQNREWVVKKFDDLINTNLKLKEKIKILVKGKNVVCVCAPKLCHGNPMVILANS